MGKILFTLLLVLTSSSYAADSCEEKTPQICRIRLYVNGSCQSQDKRKCKTHCHIGLITRLESVKWYDLGTVPWDSNCSKAADFENGRTRLSALADELKAAGICGFILDETI